MLFTQFNGAPLCPARLSVLHFDEARVGLEQSITVTLYQEVRGLKNASPKKKQRHERLQLLNLALDATVAWLDSYARNGVHIHLDGNRSPTKFYPRILRYDADQPELVAIVGKTCYLCMGSKADFGDPELECGNNHDKRTTRLSAAKLKALLNFSFSGKKALCASRGMRNPSVSYRLLSAAHSPLIEARVGGIPRLIRADSLHILELGLLKKFFEDFTELMTQTFGSQSNALWTVNSKFIQIRTTPLTRFSQGPFRTDELGGSEYVSFIWQLPEALVQARGELTETDSDSIHSVLLSVLRHAHLCRELTFKLRFQSKFNSGDNDAEHIASLVRHIRSEGHNVFLRKHWDFPKSHTLSAFSNLENGIGSCHRGEAAHRYLKERIRYLHRRGDYAGELLQLAVSKELQQLLRPPHQSQSSKTCVRYQNGVPTLLTDASLDGVVSRAVVTTAARSAVRGLSEACQWEQAGIYLVGSVKPNADLPFIHPGTMVHSIVYFSVT